jgi:hypothetical protein
MSPFLPVAIVSRPPGIRYSPTRKRLNFCQNRHLLDIRGNQQGFRFLDTRESLWLTYVKIELAIKKG